MLGRSPHFTVPLRSLLECENYIVYLCVGLRCLACNGSTVAWAWMRSSHALRSRSEGEKAEDIIASSESAIV